jgi:hypothetical protein
MSAASEEAREARGGFLRLVLGGTQRDFELVNGISRSVYTTTFLTYLCTELSPF